MRCISKEANQVTTAPATVISANGRVDKALLGASMWPVNAVSVRSMEMAATNRPLADGQDAGVAVAGGGEADVGMAESVGSDRYGAPRQAGWRV